MVEKVEKFVEEEVSDYIEGLHFRYTSLEMVMKLQYIPSEFFEIDNSTKEFYLEKFNEAYGMFKTAMEELKSSYFPEAGEHDRVSLDFTRSIAILEKHNHGCQCNGKCSL